MQRVGFLTAVTVGVVGLAVGCRNTHEGSAPAGTAGEGHGSDSSASAGFGGRSGVAGSGAPADTTGDAGRGEAVAQGGSAGSRGGGGPGPSTSGGGHAGAAPQGGSSSTGGSDCQPTVASPLLWTFSATDGVKTPIIAEDGTIYLSSSDNRLYALDPSDGSEKWAFVAAGGVSVPAIGRDGLVFVSTSNHRMHAVDSSDGSERWSFDVEEGLYAPAVAQDGTVLLPSYHVLYALDPTDGSERWSFTSNALTTPAVTQDGTVLVPANDIGAFRLVALDPDDGSELWSFPTGSYVATPLVGDDGTVYLPTEDNALYALSPATGAPQWSFNAEGAMYTPALSNNGLLLVPLSFEHTLYAVNRTTHAPLWSFTAGDFIDTPAVGTDGAIYLPSNDHHLYVLDPSDGSVRWSFPIYDNVNTPAVGADGTVYQPSWNGNLYALSLSQPGVTDLACTPCTAACASDTELGRCLPDGSGYEVVMSCSSGQACQGGACMDCVAEDHRGCVGSEVHWFDSCGTAGTLIETCSPWQKCAPNGYCQATDVGSRCDECPSDATSCRLTGSDVCQDSSLKTCIGLGGDSMYCTASCVSDADCPSSMGCLVDCGGRSEYEGLCWRTSQYEWLRDVLCDTGGTTTVDPFAQARIDCVARINALRAGEGLPPYEQWVEAEACADAQAEADATDGAHANFGDCDEAAQNTCPGWADLDAVLEGCLQAMWDEGPGDVPEEHVHYIILSSTEYSRVACGFYQMPSGEIWASQDFQ